MNSAFFQKKAPVVNLIGLVAAVVGIVCSCLAKVSLKMSMFGVEETISEGIISHYGYVLVGFFLATAIIFFFRMDNCALIVSVINAVHILFRIINETSTDTMGMGKITVNIFFWLALVAAIVDVAAVFVGPMLMGKKNNSQPTL